MNSSWSAVKIALFVSVLSLLTVGCATNGARLTPDDNITAECVDSAKYARSIGILKEAGIPADELEQYMTRPAVTKIPMRDIQEFSKFFKGNPNELYHVVMKLCTFDGWTRLSGQLRVATAIAARPEKDQDKVLSKPVPTPDIRPPVPSRVVPNNVAPTNSVPQRVWLWSAPQKYIN